MRASHLCASVFICGFSLLFLIPPAVRAEEPDFIISYWCGPPAEFLTLERFQEIKNANFTLAFPPCAGMTAEQNRKMLDLCQQVGLRAVVTDRRMVKSIGGKAENTARLDAIIREYSDHPALFGYHIVDEPGAAAFTGLAEVVAYLKEKDPQHPGFINLLPTYGRFPNILQTPTYEEYVRRFVDKTKPFVISYDHYNFKATGDRDDFFENLWTVRKVALERKLPFWNIVLATQHFSYRNLTEAELRWEAMQTVAFGAKGLLWFTYWMPHGVPNEQGWKHSLINADGTRDPHYDMIKKINGEVLAIAHELKGRESIEVFRPGTPVTTRPSAAAASPPISPSASCPIKIIDAGDLTVGVFKSPQDDRLALIVNRDYKNETRSRAVIGPVNAPVESFDVARKAWTQAPIRERSVVEISLPPGGAMLLRW